jgi:exonuclease VII large subunit
MTDHTVDALLATLDVMIRSTGAVTVTGELTGWRTHRSGTATAELTCGQPLTARIRVAARRYAAASATGELADAGRTTTAPGRVSIYGHIVIHPRWGLQLTLLRLRCIDDTPAAADDNLARPNTALTWPRLIATIGLLAPAGGDDARADVIAHLATTDLTIIEHRVGVTGPRAAAAIGHALDRLALDPRPDVTLIIRGGGPVSDFAPFDTTLVITAIGRHPRPVVTGLGHADNHTAADRAAHTSCITPTAAAQLVLATNTPPPPTR